jgi:NADPH:quinone reductase-like Zn-dependent oxidoreductase
MKAIVFTKYGSPDVLEFKDIEKPTPKDNEVLIKVQAASVNAADWHLLRADPFLVRLMFGLTKPKYTVLGADIAGIVEAVGKNVTQFKVGDEVFGDVSGHHWGGYAEYVCAIESGLVLKPANITFEAAAASGIAAFTALQGLNKGNIHTGQKVLINGASGGVGTFAVQIAKSFGAEVTAICSTNKVELVKSLGADYVIDYTKEDFTESGKTYDLIIAANGKQSLSEYKRALNPGGIYVMSGGAGSQMAQAIFFGKINSITSGKKMSNLMAKPDQKDLLFIAELLKTGKLKPVIDKTYSLAETAEAIRYIEEGHAKGKVVITMGLK